MVFPKELLYPEALPPVLRLPAAIAADIAMALWWRAAAAKATPAAEAVALLNLAPSKGYRNDFLLSP
jgi:hypothetical protein